ncbi:MAG: glycosyltransferase family 9 protein [Acidobacteriaceae bacterium]
MPQLPVPTWKRAAFRAIARSERALRGGAHPGAERLNEIRNFLLLQYEAPLGSVVHATPLLEALKTAMPDAHIAVAASPMAASALCNSPFLNGRLTATASPFSSLRSAADVRGLMRAMPPGPRCVITTIGNQRTRLAMLGLLAGKSVRAGYTLAPEIYDVPLTFTPERGQIEGNLDILRALGYEVAFCEPRVFFDQLDAEFATQSMEAIPEEPGAPRIAFVTRNSGGQRNQWSTERFRQVIADLSHSCGAVPVFLGTAIDAPAIEALRHALPNAGVSLAGKTTIPQLAAVLAQCDLIVSLDTGTFHVARAVGLPGVVIAPAWQDPREWLPVNHIHYRVLRGPSIPAAPPGYCIEEITAEQVSAAATDLLGHFPPSSAARAARVQAAVHKPR